MQKKITAHLYTQSKIIWKDYEPIMILNDDGFLFSQRKYRTKILPKDLPEWYVEGRYYGHHGYLSAKGVKFLYYRPNYFVNHMFKDDFLFISYDTPIIAGSTLFDITGADEHICGSKIVTFLKAAEKYSDYNISGIKNEIEKKRLWFKATYPVDYILEMGTSENEKKIF